MQVDKLGNVQASGPAASNYHPTDAVIARDLADVIVYSCAGFPSTRSTCAPIGYAPINSSRPRGNFFLNDYAQHNDDPFARVGKEQVSVHDVTSVVRASDQSFRVEWVERHYVDGALAATERWNAIVTVTISPPRTADDDILNVNPLGIYVDALNWSKELNLMRLFFPRTSSRDHGRAHRLCSTLQTLPRSIV